MIRTISSLNVSIRVILLGILLLNTSFFMMMPFLGLYLNTQMQLDALRIGMVLTTLVLFERGFTFFGGYFSDRFGIQKLIIIGLVIRIIGYFLFAISKSFILFILSAAVVGTGGALLAPGLKAGIVAKAEDNRVQVFALRGIAVNIGAAVGPILGGVLYNQSFFLVFLIIALSHIVFLFLLVKLGLKEIKVGSTEVKMVGQVRYIFSDKKILLLTLILGCFWFLYNQFNLSIPLYAQDQFGFGAKVGWLATLNGLLVILLQYGLVKWLFNRYNDVTILSLGMLLISGAFLVLSFLPFYYSLFVFTVLFTLSEILVFPTVDNLTAKVAPSDKVASYYGFVDIGWALGSMLGNVVGGFIYGLARENNQFWWIWLIYGLISLSVISFVFFFKKVSTVSNQSPKTEENVI